MSCHEIGKSFIAALIACWWIDTHKLGEAFVVTSAPSASQVRTILWREIGRIHSLGELPGRVNQVDWIIEINGREEQVAVGRKPDEYNPTALQGIHAPFVLVIFDEGCGIRGPLWDAADSLIANDAGKFLTIGNPDDPLAEFYEFAKPGSGYAVVQVGAFDTPNFTGEDIPDTIKRNLIGKRYVEEKRKKWAPNWVWTEDGARCVCPEGQDPSATNPFWQSKVLGLFPQFSSDDTLIPLAWVRAAQERTLPPSEPHELGVDVGGGADSSTGCERRGSVYRILWEDQNPDTMATTGNVVAALHRTGARVAKVDMIGIGRGVRDRLLEVRKEINALWRAVGINVGLAARSPKHYVNKRSEDWWTVREEFEGGTIDIDPNDEDLAAELVQIKYKRTSLGKIQIESKQEARARGVASPNRADSLMLARADERSGQRRATFGK
jgi:hypothetical protein